MKDFQFLRPSSLDNESSFCTLCSVNFSDVGTFLGEMCDIKEVFSKQPRYPNLSKLALACVVLPNSNADSQRIFSMLNKIQTEHRSEWQMTLYAHLFVPNKIKIWNVMSIVLIQRY